MNIEMLPDFLRFLLEPVSPEQSCGEDLEYDPLYMELFIRIVPKEKKSIGGTMGSERLESEFEPVRWSEVERDCLDILRRTRDIRLLTLLLRCRAQQAGAEGLRQGLFVLEQALALWQEALYPRMSAEGEPDLLPRADALLALADGQGLLADVRALSVGGSGGLRLELRDVERSLSLPVPEDALPPEAMRHRLEELRLRNLPDFMALLDCLELVRSIDRMVRERMGQEAPELSPLLLLLGRLETRTGTDQSHVPLQEASVPEETLGEPCATSVESETTAVATSSRPATPFAISNRHVAKERIREVRLWFEENEPSSPVPLLLSQAELLIGKRFAELVRSLPADLLEKWEHDG